MTSSVVNDTRIEHEHRVDRPWKRNDETAMTGERSRDRDRERGRIRERISRRTTIGEGESTGKRYESELNTRVSKGREEKSACEQVHVKDVDPLATGQIIVRRN